MEACILKCENAPVKVKWRFKNVSTLRRPLKVLMSGGVVQRAGHFSPDSTSLPPCFANARSSDSLLYLRHAECQSAHALSCCAVCVFPLLHLTFIFFFTPSFFPHLYFISALHFLTPNNLLSCSLSHFSLTLFLIFTSSLLFLLAKAFTSFSLCHAYPHLHPPPAALLPTSPLLPLTLLLGIVLCFLAIHSLPFISHCSTLPCVFYLSLSSLSILAHLPSYNPFRLWLLCKFPHFLSLCLIPSLSFSLSCLPLRQPEYDNVISHSSTSPPSPLFSLLRLSLFVLSLYRLLTLLPSTSPCLSCSYFQSQTTHTYAHAHPWILCATHLILFYPPPYSACLRDTLPPCSSFPPSPPSFI